MTKPPVRVLVVSGVAIDQLKACAEWIESLASPTLANDPFIRAADWAAKLVREYAHALTLLPDEPA